MNTNPRPVRFYMWVFIALLVLTALTTEVARFDLGLLNTPIAVTIAAAKAVIVALFFMHLKESDYRSRVIAIAGLFWLVILVVFVIADVFTRDIPKSPEGWARLPGQEAAFEDQR